MRIDGQQTVQSAELAQYLSLFMATSTNRIQDVQSDRDALNVRSGIFDDLRTKLVALKRLASDFSSSGGLSAFAARTAASSNDAVLVASAGSGAAKLNHSVRVDQVAQAHAVISDPLASTGTSLADAMGGTTKTFKVTVDDHDYTVSVAVTAGQTNKSVLEAVATAINSTVGTAARATALSDSDTTTRLSLTSGGTGSAHAMHFTDTDGLLAATGVTNAGAATATTGGYVHADLGNHELDAKLTVDGIQITRSSNLLSDVIAGVTLTLKSAQPAADAAVSVSVGVDTKAIKDKVQKLLEAYNDVYSYLSSKISVDRTTFKRGPLAGDFGYTSLAQKLRVGVAGNVDTAANPAMSALSQVGITSTNAGAFAISDSSKFDAALDGKLDDLASLFDSGKGVGARLEAVLEDYTRSGGVLSTSTGSLTSQKKMLDTKITQLEHLQDLERERLIKQFGALQEVTAMQQTMSAMLGSLNSMITF